jgi:L-ascorbate metabolism protein UlaG (beta-lactamase superfamily)
VKPLRFVNLDGTGPRTGGEVFRWAVVDRFAGRRRTAPARAPIPQVAPDLGRLARPPGVGEGVRLTWLGHASWLVQLAGKSLLIDPVLGERISGVIRRNVPPGIPIDRLPPVDGCLVTHNHYDHLDLPTLQRVGAPVWVGQGTAAFLRREGLTAYELAWWDSARLGSVMVHFVPSQHWSRRGLFDVNTMLWGGFVVEGGSHRVYHSGDTAYFEGFAEIGRRFPGLAVAMLPIGAYDPPWFMESQHMNPEQAVRAYRDLGARDFLAMHWGTFKLTDEPLEEPPTRLQTEWTRLALPEDHLKILPVGATWEWNEATAKPEARATGERQPVPDV